TILASRVVQHLQQLRERGNPTGYNFLLLYFFFKHHQPDKRSFVPMLLSLLSQAVFQDEVLLDLVYQRCIRADQTRIRSASLLRELADLVLKAQSMCFVVVDTLDECTEDQSTRAEDAQGQASSGPRDRSIRLLISGQRNGLLEGRLRHWPTLQVDSSLSHMTDIKTYCGAESLRIQQKFGASEDVRLGIIDKVTSTAKAGMFLYTKVVLSNLWVQPTRRHFKRELQEENFPKAMDQAYERVAVHILERPDESQSDLARGILNLVICAERPLFWKEIQARFCIDVQSETADLDFRLLEPGKKYFSALIEVGRKDLPGSPASEPDDLVELVHETARIYLFQTGRFHLADLHADMALFCAQYLSSAPFNPDMGKPAVTMHCRTGYYGFLDYAAANWWKHARQIECSKNTTILTTVAKMADALNSRDETTTANTATDMTAVRTLIHQIPGDGRDWEDAFPIEARVKLARACLESLLGHANTESSADLEEISNLYGRVAYKCSKPNLNISKAAREGKLELIQELVTGGTSVDVQQKDGSTPLFLAARAGNYQVCRWLLEHEAKADTRCTKETITALWAAVANDDLEIASLLIVDHGADISVHDSTGATMRALMERSRCTRIPERFPLEFWLSGNPGKTGPGNTRPDVPNRQATTWNYAAQDSKMQLMLLEEQHMKRPVMLLDQQNQKRLMMWRQEQDLSNHPTSTRTSEFLDRQMQLILLEQQNKKRLMMTRQEKDLTTADSDHPLLDK
ncbi:putative zinc finger protein, partial [Staphylotrichum tortipilum]